MASGSMHGLSQIIEASRGSTPATPAMTPIRHTSCTITETMEFSQSAEIRSDRQITDTVMGGYKVGGDIGIELSYGSFDPILQSLLMGTWNTDVLKAGTTRRYHTIESLCADIASVDSPFTRWRGCEFDKLSASVKASGGGNAKIDATLSVVGKDQATDTVIITGETYAAASTTTPFNSFSGTITEGGSAIAIVSELSFSLVNGLVPQYFVGAQASDTPDVNQSNVTGNLTAAFRNVTLMNKFLAGTESAIVLTLSDPAGNTLAIEFPRIKYTGFTRDISGPGSIMQSLPFQALYSTGGASNIVITRNPI